MDEGAGSLTGAVRYGPRQSLPVPVKPLRGESTSSFVNRLAHAQGLELDELLQRVGFGQASRDPQRIRAYPASIEMYVNRLGLEYLATLAGSSPTALRRALPSLAARFLEPDAPVAQWTWPWIPRAGHLVPLCAACGRRRGVEETVWMISPDRWRLCTTHQYFTDDTRAAIVQQVPLTELPETVTAQQQRQQMSLRLGSAGRQLFADAFQVVAYWWTTQEDVERWVRRAWGADLEARELRTSSPVMLPEVAVVAERMAAFEQAGERDRHTRAVWLAGLQTLMDVWQVDFSAGKEPLMQWLEHHRSPPPAPGRAPAGSEASGRGASREANGGRGAATKQRMRLPAGHTRRGQPTGVLGDHSCLHWRLGEAACDL